ncbi:MAG: polysaccharide deacetylase family protein [Clostridia bacterium]|nr:polysaccharide deacetylase family protein [Clostridia bacterium]
MTNMFFMRFPGGLGKAFTLSYDDNVQQDVRLMEVLDRHGLKCTFNLNSGKYAPEGKVYEEGRVHRPMSRSEVTAAYAQSGHEVAVHAYTHPFLEQLPDSLVVYEIIKDREALEEQFGRIVRGMAYPYGTYSDAVVEDLRRCGIVYARTTKATKKFSVPTDWLRLHPTCHHDDPEVMELCDRFTEMKVKQAPQLFYLWGHSYEFEGKNNWEHMEEIAARMGGHEDIWYATNMEIYEYVEAYRQLVLSADGTLAYNPTAKTVWLEREKTVYRIDPGQTCRIRA